MPEWEITKEELAATLSAYVCDECGDHSEKLIEVDDGILLICEGCAIVRMRVPKSA